MRQVAFHHASTGRKPQVITVAEIGVNHDGSLDRAKDLIAVASDSGADAVKFQCFDPSTLLSNEAPLASYQERQASDASSMLNELRLTREDLQAVRNKADRVGLAFVVTPFSVADVAVLGELGVDAVKIASPDAVNPWLLDAAAELGRPLWVSTGTCDLNDLQPAAARLRTHGPGGALLHCVSAYPTPIAQAALGGIAALRDAFSLPTGYSDHTLGEHTGALAVSAGACLLEKHLTHDRSSPGPDHAASLEPEELARYIAKAHEAAAALGPVAKRCTEAERDVRAVSRQSLVYTADLPAGHVLTRNDLETRRPGTGIPAAAGPDWIGRRLNRPVTAGTLAQEQDAEAPDAAN